MEGITRSDITEVEVLDESHAVRDLLHATWWTFALRGVLALALGILFLAQPARTMSTLVIVFGAWAIVDGAITLIAAITRRKSWELGVLGVLGIALGYLILTRPAGATLLFFIFAAAWIMSRGVTEIAIGASLPKGTTGRATLIVMGILGFAFGLFLVAVPAVGVPVLVWWIAFYALFEGISSLTVAYQVRKLKRVLAAPMAPPFTPHAVPS